MSFTSYGFYGFIIILFLLYYLLPKKFQWELLLIASCFFYLCAGPRFIIYILLTGATVYLTGRAMERSFANQQAQIKANKGLWGREEKKACKEKHRRTRKCFLAVCLIFNIGMLATLKCGGFLVPLGISFYTLQAAGYLIDVYRETVPAEKNFFKFMLFVSFFPQLIQGPISRWGDLCATLYGEHQFDAKGFFYGLQRMLWGYFKKMVIADRLLAGVSCITGSPETYYGSYAFVGMILYTIELYADFTGGIDITIGIAQALGIKVQENFMRPYFSKSLKEYWRRWHISMCSWFRDYVFYPVSVCPPMKKFTKLCRTHLGENAGKRIPVYASSFVVWFATGIWHGTSWNYIAWGLANWFVLMASEELSPLYGRFHARFNVGKSFAYKVFQIGRTFLLICVLNLFDCYEKVSTTFSMLISILTARNWGALADGSLLNIGLSVTDYVIAAVGVVILLCASLIQRGGGLRDRVAAKPYPLRVCVWFGMFLAVLLLGAYGIGYDASQFIYNRF